MPYITHKTIRRQHNALNRLELARVLKLRPWEITVLVNRNKIMPPDFPLGVKGAWTAEAVEQIKKEFAAR